MEAQISQLQQSQDLSLARHMEVNDKVNSVIDKANKGTFAGVVSKISDKTVVSQNQTIRHGPLLVTNIPPLRPSRDVRPKDDSTLTKKKVHPSSPPMSTTSTASVLSSASITTISRQDDPDGFQLPRYAQRKIDRSNSRKVIRGSATSTGPLKGATVTPQHRDLFVYKVDKSVDTSILEQYVIEKGVTVLNLKCVSHDEATYKSFQLTVPKIDFAGLLEGDVWPEGICVRRFRSKQTRQ